MATLKMEAKFPLKETLSYIQENIDDLDSSLTLDGSVGYDFGEKLEYMMVFEEYFLRRNSYASLTILLTGDDKHTTIDVVASGGASGIWKISFGTEESFLKQFKKMMEKKNFKIVNNEKEME